MPTFGHRLFKPAHAEDGLTHWDTFDDLHRAIHDFDGPFRAILLELVGKPMSRREMRDFLRHPSLQHWQKRSDTGQLTLAKNLEEAERRNVVEQKDGAYHLTLRGREMTTHMESMIPAVINRVLSPEVVSIAAFVLHVFLSVLKLGIGYLAHSASLFADGIDNGMDALSAALVWVGLKYDKVRLISWFLLVMMVLSVGGIGLAALNKVLHPAPLSEGPVAFAVSAVCGFIMLLLSAYQYVVGKKRGNLAILCQSVDSRNHFWTSLLVCAGILLSYFAEMLAMPWLYYADVAASVVIGFMVLRGAVDIGREILSADAEDEPDVSHFMRSLQDKHRMGHVRKWIAAQLQREALTREELHKRFMADFCEQVPRLHSLTGIGMVVRQEDEFTVWLERLLEKDELIEDEGRLWLAKG